MYRLRNGALELLLAHPGGPFWARRDMGAWSIPKGEFDLHGEEPLSAARREFAEETGHAVDGDFIDLGVSRQAGGKTVHAWAVQGDLDPARVKNDTFSMEWPPRSGKQQTFPEIDRVGWFGIETAKAKFNSTNSQQPQKVQKYSIFKNTGNDLRELLTEYKPDEILYVSIDVAKYNHSSMIANLFGDVIVPKFGFPYNNHGIDFLRKKLNLTQKQTNARKVFFGLESTGHYHENLTAALTSLGYNVAVINPSDTKDERDNIHAKTDNIDLAAIARAIMTNKGRRSYIPDTIYYNLRRASRTHRQFTQQETGIKNVITMLVDKTFNGLWDP